MMRVPPSTTPQGAVEWFEPMARTGEGYFTGSFRMETTSAVELASTTTCGCETKSPNQFVTVDVGMEFPPRGFAAPTLILP